MQFTVFLTLLVLGQAVNAVCFTDLSRKGTGRRCQQGDAQDAFISFSKHKVVHHATLLLHSTLAFPGVQQHMQQQQHSRSRVYLSQPLHHSHAPAANSGTSVRHKIGNLGLYAAKLVPKVVRQRSRRVLQQLGGALDAMMLAGMGGGFGMGNAAGYGDLGGINSLLGLSAGSAGLGSSYENSMASLAGWGDLSGLTGYYQERSAGSVPYQTFNGMVPLKRQAASDVAGLSSQVAQALPAAKQSVAYGARMAADTMAPYINNGNNIKTLAANAVQLGGSAKQQIIQGTVLPMASGGINALSNVGTNVGSGVSQGYEEGYAAVMDRRAPYQDASVVQQQYRQQPALYLPQSYAPLGYMANITYPCPRSPQNIVAPVGTIIGPGIPCGVPLLVVPKSAVPDNRAAPPVVNPIPVAAPAPPPGPPSPVPIPVTPLPPPSGGGGGTLPPVVPPVVNPSPTPNTSPPTVPPIVNPSPTPDGGTTIPTTPPGGLTPPIVNPSPSPADTAGAPTPASLRSTGMAHSKPNYMSYSEPIGSGSRTGGAAQVTAPDDSADDAVAAARTKYLSSGSRMRRGSSGVTQQQAVQQGQQMAGPAGQQSKDTRSIRGTSLLSRFIQGFRQ